MDLAQTTRSFFAQLESRAAFPVVNGNEKLVKDAYAKLLERAPDTGSAPIGLASW